jgi:hypothetical protein
MMLMIPMMMHQLMKETIKPSMQWHQDKDDHLQEESSRKRKIYQEKMNFLLQFQDVFLLTKQRQYVIRKMDEVHKRGG